MQIINVSEQIKIMAFAVILGCIFALVYDIIKAVRTSLNFEGKLCFVNAVKEILFVHIIDIIYMIAVSVSYCIFLFYFSSGHSRWYVFISLVIGFFVCRVSLSRVFRKVLTETICFIKIIISKAVWLPLVKLSALIRYIIMPIINRIRYKHLMALTDSSKKSYIDELVLK